MLAPWLADFSTLEGGRQMGLEPRGASGVGLGASRACEHAEQSPGQEGTCTGEWTLASHKTGGRC